MIATAILLSLLASGRAIGQERAREHGLELLQEGRFGEAEGAFAEWLASEPANADAVFYVALSRALQGRTAEARTGFLRALSLDPRRTDARFELAASYLKAGDYRTAFRWAIGGLRRTPDDEYGNELAATILYLSGAKEEALRYWNHLGRPHLGEIRISTNQGLSRQSIADEINLAPGDLLSWVELRKARWRLGQHSYLRRVVFDPVPGADPDDYALDVTADGRQGLGKPTEVLFNALGDISFRTLRLEYANIAGSSVTASARWRWPPEARLAQVDVSVPRLAHRAAYSLFSYSHRDETWVLPAAVDEYRLRSQELSVRTTIPLHLPAFWVVASITGRDRRLLPVDGGNGLYAGPVPPRDLATTGTIWFKALPRLAFPPTRLNSDWSLAVQVRTAVEGGWNRGRAGGAVSKVSLSPEVRLERSGGARRSLVVAVHGGAVSRLATLEDSFVLGAGPDAQYPLRAHPFLVGGHPGSAPLARGFALGSATATTELHRWTWFSLGLVGFLDYAQVFDAYPGQALPRGLLDGGIGAEVGSSLNEGRAVTLMWGRDVAAGLNRFYVSVSFR